MADDKEIFKLIVNEKGLHISSKVKPNEQIGILHRVINEILNNRMEAQDLKEPKESLDFPKP